MNQVFVGIMSLLFAFYPCWIIQLRLRAKDTQEDGLFSNSSQLVLILLLWNECRLLFCLFHLMTKKLPFKALHLDSSAIVLLTFFQILISQLSSMRFDVVLCNAMPYTVCIALQSSLHFYNMHKTEIIQCTMHNAGHARPSQQYSSVSWKDLTRC